jgi:glycyl-tRNA synthetase beta chain
MQDSLLIELLTEELPPKSLIKLSQAFSKGIFEGLKEQGFIAADADYAGVVTEFATPRRLAVLIKDVLGKQPERMIERKGPALASAFDQNKKAMPALIGFAKSCGVEIEKLQKQSGPKGEYFVFRAKQPGEALEKHLSDIVASVIKKLPVAKLMRWGDSEVEFVRPVHGLMMLRGKKIVPGVVLNLHSGNKTLGHRFLRAGEVIVPHADDYEAVLEKVCVIADFERRQELICQKLDEQAKKYGNTVIWNRGDTAELLAEVASLVEYPVVYAASFDPTFLDVPKECLIVSMQHHQRYFPLQENVAQPKLLPQFLFVSNNQADDPRQIVKGNERVLRARLTDAKFFFEQDKKTELADRVPKLANVVYHNKLGNQLQRVERIQKLAVAIAERLREIKFVADIKHAERAAYLCKADLLTDMVGEFPELQGIMGYYYALHDGEAPEVAEAIREHYERVPKSAVGVCVGLADKVEILMGIYGIGLVPTGEKDPFALRRHALSVVRTLAENKLALNLMQLLEIAEAQFPSDLIAKDTVPKLYDFILERVKPYLREQDYGHDEIEAVLSLRPTRMDWIVPRLKAIQAFRNMPEAESLAAANKRIRNILKQAQGEPMEMVNAGLLKLDEEKHLAQHLALLEAEVMPLIHHEEYTQALKHLASLRPAVDAFFDKVMVMVEDKALRDNRLALLTKLEGLFMRVADISKLHYGGQQP